MSDSKLVTDATTAKNGQYVQVLSEMRREVPMPKFSHEEEDLIERMFRLVGKRWHLIAGRIPGRTVEEIEKYWTSRCSSSSDQCLSSA